MLRREVAERTMAGLEAQSFMDRGELVPDRLVTGLIAGRITGPDAPDGFVLDGFPRSIPQAEAAYEWARTHGKTFDAVIALDVPEDELVKRLLERGRETGRFDDTEDTIRTRLQVYEKSTEPLEDFYREREILHEIYGLGTPDEVADRINKALDRRR
jgi:adenylate kinase